MEVHKPRPWRGWREFLKEYLIIVVGVLTALAAEQAVENLHERHLSAEARSVVREEINLNITNISRRWKFQSCIDRRIAEIGQLLDRAENGEAFDAPLLVGQPQGLRSSNQRWLAATAAGRTSLLSSQEQEDLGRIYTQLDLVVQRQEQEEVTWAHLIVLEGRSRLSPEMIAAARAALGEARVESAGIKRNLARARANGERLGIKGDATLINPGEGSRFAICLPMNTPRPEALRLVGEDATLP